MRIILLAAGKGERLMPLTRNTPKSLLDMGNGKTLLEEQIERMQASGVIDEIVLVVGYLADQVEAKIRMHLENGIKINTCYNPFYEMSNNLISLWLAKGEMTEDFLVANGDCLFTAETYAGLVGGYEQGIVLSVNYKDSYDEDDMKVRLADNLVVQVSKEIKVSEVDAESPGLALVRGKKFRRLFRETLETLARDRNYLNRFWLEVFNRLIFDGRPIHFWPFDRNMPWQEVDFHMDIKNLKEIVKIGNV